MAQPIYAGQTLKAAVTIENKGGMLGSFVLTGQIRYTDGRHAGWFFPSAVDYCNQTMPTGANEYRTALSAYQVKTVTMYKVNWACGINDAFYDGEDFNIRWTLKCVETGEEATLTYFRAIEHKRSLAPPTPSPTPPPPPPPEPTPPPEPPAGLIASVSLFPDIADYGGNVNARVTIKNVGGSRGTFRLYGQIIDENGDIAGNLWNLRVTGDPLQAERLIREAGAVNYVEQSLGAGSTIDLRMYTAPLWAPSGGQVRNRINWRLVCLETGQEVTRRGMDSFTVLG